MTDDIETDASTTQSISKVEPDQQQQGWTDEELMQFIEDDVMVRMKCESCGYEEDVPDWILEEFLEIELHNGSKERRYSRPGQSFHPGWGRSSPRLMQSGRLFHQTDFLMHNPGNDIFFHPSVQASVQNGLW